jgi:assimilatory nitrate reductase electron transfer subunit
MSTVATWDRAASPTAEPQQDEREVVVVVGAGMVGHRFVEEAARHDPEGRLELHLVGEEDAEPYNRILLTEVLAGRASLRSLTLPRLPERVALHSGTAAAAVDRCRREVLLADGRTLRYDRLVLTTGARPFVPPITGLEERPRHVHVVRDLGDTRAVLARAMNARHAVVLGGGVLGLEAACALAGRGVAVTVVQNEPQLMAGQLDPAPAQVLRQALVRLGVHVRVGCSVAEAISAYGELVAVRLTDDTVLSTDLLLVSCGVRAETGLAREAGLSVDRGILVGDDLSSPDDERIHALGDCAQPPEGMTGLVAPGWTQAERLARRLAATSDARRSDPEPATGTRPRPVPADVRLKAVGIDLCVLGTRPSAAAAEDRVICVDDPRGGRHIGLVVRGDRLVGATCLGAPSVAAELSILVERGTPLPEDPLALLTPEREPGVPATSPVGMPGATTVCRCNGVTKADVVAAWEAGATTAEAVSAETRAVTGCGGCAEVVCGLVSWLEETAGTAPAAVQQLARP